MRHTCRIIGVTLLFGIGSLAVPAVAGAAANPSGSGQPSQECGSTTAPSGPAGFDTGGFANAEARYAGSAPQNSKNPHSVSQYDVACYQVSQHR
jgi:hypothetical protein